MSPHGDTVDTMAGNDTLENDTNSASASSGLPFLPKKAEKPLPSLPRLPLQATMDPSAPWTVQSVLNTIPHPPRTSTSTSSSPPITNSPLPFLHTIARLKSTPRTGWLRFSITNPESISDHMYRMAILSMLCPPSLIARGINVPHCTKMALLHDMAECIVGDITPVDGVAKEEKHRRERETMEFLCCGVSDASSTTDKDKNTRSLSEGGVGPGLLKTASPALAQAGEDIRAVWQEYEDDETLEARFVHDLDKFELLVQMLEYEREMEGRVDFGEFVRVAQGVRLGEMKAWAREVLLERETFWRERGNRTVGGEGGGKEVAKLELGRSLIEGWERELGITSGADAGAGAGAGGGKEEKELPKKPVGVEGA
ncbi:hypothetical protein MMC25_006621 [Agyrium rufum]|nr:hypothetical protein [Agyrium rufum]